jgi:hypothetical protein
LAWLVVFKGYLYGGVHNSTEGAQLWRVPTNNIDGPWSEVWQAHDGFGCLATNSELHRATVAAGCLWVATLSAGSLGSQVWRTCDGETFDQSNVSGFTPTNRTSGFVAITGFGTNVVWGGGTTSTGAQIWRTAPAWFTISNGTPADWMNQYFLTNDTQDTDGDGLTNWQEYVTGTDPTDSGSLFSITRQDFVTNGGFSLCWPSISDRVYDVERSTNLATAGFEAISSNLPPTPPMNVHTDSAALSGAAYRIRVKSP